MEQSKSILLSKTFWTQVLTFGLAFIPSVNSFIQSHPEAFVALFGFVNIVLRAISKDKIYLV